VDSWAQGKYGDLRLRPLDSGVGSCVPGHYNRRIRDAVARVRGGRHGAGGDLLVAALEGKAPLKVIHAGGKLVNIVVR